MMLKKNMGEICEPPRVIKTANGQLFGILNMSGLLFGGFNPYEK